MAFDRSDTDALFDGTIAPLLSDMGITPIRVDRTHWSLTPVPCLQPRLQTASTLFCKKFEKFWCSSVQLGAAWCSSVQRFSTTHCLLFTDSCPLIPNLCYASPNRGD